MMGTLGLHCAVLRRLVVGVVTIAAWVSTALPLRAHPVPLKPERAHPVPLKPEKEECKFCQDWPKIIYTWSLCDEKGKTRRPSQNNLGGLGPTKGGEHEIRYPKVMVKHPGETYEKSYDLIVQNITPYTPHNISRHLDNPTPDNSEAIHGCFGVVNVEHDTSVTLRFAIRLHGKPFIDSEPGDWLTDNQQVPFSVWDVDHNFNKGSEERVLFEIKRPWKANQEETTYEAKNLVRVISKTYKEADKSDVLEVGSLEHGNGADNPLNISTGEDKSIEIGFIEPNYWDVTFVAKGGNRGRNLLFGSCRPCPKPPTAPTPAPTAAPTPAPTAAPTAPTPVPTFATRNGIWTVEETSEFCGDGNANDFNKEEALKVYPTGNFHRDIGYGWRWCHATLEKCKAACETYVLGCAEIVFISNNSNQCCYPFKQMCMHRTAAMPNSNVMVYTFEEKP